jgi:hypothetical protein
MSVIFPFLYCRFTEGGKSYAVKIRLFRKYSNPEKINRASFSEKLALKP